VLYRASFDQTCLRGYSRFSVGTKQVMKQIVDLIKQVMENK